LFSQTGRNRRVLWNSGPRPIVPSDARRALDPKLEAPRGRMANALTRQCAWPLAVRAANCLALNEIAAAVAAQRSGDAARRGDR